MKKYEKATPHEFTWTPILWAMKLLQKAKQEGKIQVSTFSVAAIDKTLNRRTISC